KILEARQEDQKIIQNEEREKEKKKLKEQVAKNERIEKYVSSGAYSEDELNIIKEEILKLPWIPEITEEMYEDYRKKELFDKISYNRTKLGSANFETVSLISEVLGYDKLYTGYGEVTALEDELTGVIEAVEQGWIEFNEVDGIIRIGNSITGEELNKDDEFDEDGT
ncbi:MAG TPA: hypothetical protein DF712_14895, partial [Balneola sp.]|nr:hypothetical protein [Balneola sp.]